jgi:thymidylate synthase ThyX
MYEDKGHRPHIEHTDEMPSTLIDEGPDGLKVTLESWGPNDGHGFAAIYNQIESTYGDEPCAVERDADLTKEQWDVVINAIEGRALQNPLEALTFMFTIDGCTRACTHEAVRTRIGASFAQHGGRDNDWRHRRFRRPEVVDRAIVMDCIESRHRDGFLLESAIDLDRFYQCIDHYSAHPALNKTDLPSLSLLEIEKQLLAMCKTFYAALLDSGVASQDARRYLPIGLETYLHCNYNWLALKGFIANRTEHGAMDWEIDCVAQLMIREVYHRCPRPLAENLKSHSDRTRVNRFATMYAWPPNRKWPEPDNYDHNHPCKWRHNQVPFFILDPVCLIDPDYAVTWIPTNGEWRHDYYDNRVKFANEVATIIGVQPLTEPT